MVVEHMKIIPARMLAAQPQVVWEDLEREGAIVITEDGLPRSIMVPTSGATLLEDIQELCSRGRAGQYERFGRRLVPPVAK